MAFSARLATSVLPQLRRSCLRAPDIARSAPYPALKAAETANGLDAVRRDEVRPMKVSPVGLLRRSLKTRITLITLVIFLAGIWSLSFYAHRILRDDMARLLGEQQLSSVSMVAAQVEREFEARLETLEAVARLSAVPMQTGPAAMQRFLQHRFDLHVLFSDGIFATRLDGTAVAAAPDGSERVGINYGDSESMLRALHEGKAAIGRPALSKTAQIPVISIAVPIRDGRGKVIGALAGVTHLGIPNFLDQLITGHYGKTGGYRIIAPQHRLIVTASNKQRVTVKRRCVRAKSTFA